jgi:hypothetical protein
MADQRIGSDVWHFDIVQNQVCWSQQIGKVCIPNAIRLWCLPVLHVVCTRLQVFEAAVKNRLFRSRIQYVFSHWGLPYQ